MSESMNVLLSRLQANEKRQRFVLDSTIAQIAALTALINSQMVLNLKSKNS